MKIFVLLTLFLMTMVAFAEGEIAEGLVVANVPVDIWLKSIVSTYGSWGEFIGWQAKSAAIIYVIIGSMKVSFIRPLWDGLGKAKVFAAPVLSLLSVIFMAMAAKGEGMSAYQMIWMGLTTGAGALALSNLMEAIRSIPGIGSIPNSIIHLLENILKRPTN